jgi:hypothetical protein
LFTFVGEKFKFSAQESDLAPFVANGTIFTTPSDIKPPLVRGRGLFCRRGSLLFIPDDKDAIHASLPVFNFYPLCHFIESLCSCSKLTRSLTSRLVRIIQQ